MDIKWLKILNLNYKRKLIKLLINFMKIRRNEIIKIELNRVKSKRKKREKNNGKICRREKELSIWSSLITFWCKLDK